MEPGSNKILLVEDEALIALELIDYLEQKGHEVTHVNSLPEAIDEARRPGWRAAIVDFWLFEECAAPLLNLLHSNDVPFLIYSGDINKELRRYPSGRIIDKPTSCDSIFNALQGLAVEERNQSN